MAHVASRNDRDWLLADHRLLPAETKRSRPSRTDPGPRKQEAVRFYRGLATHP